MNDIKKLKKMNLVNKLYQPSILNEIKKIDFNKGSKNPLVIELDTTEVCNLACPGCISEDIISNRGSFSKKRLLKLGDEFIEAGVKAVILIGGGEPLYHPAVGDLMENLGKNDVQIGITTNGTTIHKYMDTIAKYSNWTRVSMDAGTAETFYKLRPAKSGKNVFDIVINNMRELAKKKTGKLGYSFLIRTQADKFGINSNIDDIYSAAVLARDIGCDYFEVKPSYQFENDKDHFLRVHDKKDMEHAREEISKLSELETGSFKVLKSINLEYSLDGKQYAQPKKYTSCPAAELRTLVCPSGTYVCPYFRGKQKFKIGNIKEMSFSDMWKSDERKKIMNELNPAKHCGMHCIRHDTNLEVFKIEKSVKNNEIIEPINKEKEDKFI